MDEMKSVKQLLSHIQLTGSGINTSIPCKDNESSNTETDLKAIEAPWIDELFYKFSLVYQTLWSMRMPSENDILAYKKIFYDALRQFRVETIDRAVKYMIEHEPYPELHLVVKYCEEFSQQVRYELVLLEDKSREVPSTPESKAVAEAARAEIRRLLGIRRHAG